MAALTAAEIDNNDGLKAGNFLDIPHSHEELFLVVPDSN
jgi:hypothetical protein